MEKGEIAQMSNFTFFHNVFYAICILKPVNSHISVIFCSFFEFGTVSKWCILKYWEMGQIDLLQISLLYCAKNANQFLLFKVGHFRFSYVNDMGFFIQGDTCKLIRLSVKY